MTNPAAHATFAQAAAVLEETRSAAESRPVDRSWLHGDCKTDNFMFDAGKTYAIDIGLSHENAVEHDLAQFLNQLDMLLARPRFLRLAFGRKALHEAFWRGYRATGPEVSEPCLRWLRLFGLFALWHTTVVEDGRESALRAWLLNRMFIAQARRLIAGLRQATPALARADARELTNANSLR